MGTFTGMDKAFCWPQPVGYGMHPVRLSLCALQPQPGPRSMCPAIVVRPHQLRKRNNSSAIISELAFDLGFLAPISKFVYQNQSGKHVAGLAFHLKQLRP